MRAPSATRSRSPHAQSHSGPASRNSPKITPISCAIPRPHTHCFSGVRSQMRIRVCSASNAAMPERGIPLIRSGFDDFGAANASYRAQFIGALAAALGRVGQVAEGLAAIDEEIDRTEQTEEFWIIAELLRVKGEFLYAPAHRTPPPRSNGAFVRRWTGQRGRRPVPGRCAPPRVRRVCCWHRAGPMRHDKFSRQSTTGSPRVSRPPICALPAPYWMHCPWFDQVATVPSEGASFVARPV